MSVKFFGVRTQSGSWYLLEDHSKVFGSPVWFIWSGGVKFNVNFMLAKNFAPSIANFRGLISAIIAHNPNWPAQHIGLNRDLIPSDRIEGIENFLGRLILYSAVPGSNLGIFHLQYANTSPIDATIEFK